MKYFKGRVWKFGDSVDTDIISPGGDKEGWSVHSTMSALRPEFPANVKPGDILVAGKNFGCGSHRESANEVLHDIGISVIVAESVARIFFRVSISLGYPIFIAPGISDIVEDGDELEIDYVKGIARNTKTGQSVKVASFSSSIMEIFEAGGLLPLLKTRYERESI